MRSFLQKILAAKGIQKSIGVPLGQKNRTKISLMIYIPRVPKFYIQISKITFVFQPELRFIRKPFLWSCGSEFYFGYFNR